MHFKGIISVSTGREKKGKGKYWDVAFTVSGEEAEGLVCLAAGPVPQAAPVLAAALSSPPRSTVRVARRPATRGNRRTSCPQERGYCPGTESLSPKEEVETPHPLSATLIACG